MYWVAIYTDDTIVEWLIVDDDGQPHQHAEYQKRNHMNVSLITNLNIAYVYHTERDINPRPTMPFTLSCLTFLDQQP